MFTEIICHRKIIIIIITIIITIIIIIVVVVVVSMTFHSGIAYKPLLGSDGEANPNFITSWQKFVNHKLHFASYMYIPHSQASLMRKWFFRKNMI